MPTPDLRAEVRTAVAEALPTATPSPTPDIEATIETIMAATVAAMPTSPIELTAAPKPSPAATPTTLPTATPKPLPTSTPTPMPIPTPTPTATPTPTPTPVPTPTPTPHPCSLIRLASADELRLVYTRFLAAGPSAALLTLTGREAREVRFWEIAAAYIVETIANPMRYSSFRDYLGEVGYGSVDVDLKVGIQTIQSWGLLPNEGESLYQYEQRRVDDPCTPARSMIFADDDLTTLLAIGYARSILNPFFRGIAPQIVIDNINAFRDNDVTTPLFLWWLHTYID